MVYHFHLFLLILEFGMVMESVRDRVVLEVLRPWVSV